MDLQENKKPGRIFGMFLLMLLLSLGSLCIGRFPLSLQALFSGDPYQWKVFTTLRVSRVVVGVVGGCVLGAAGYVFQIVFHNPLAAPDIIGVSSGASAGAAFGILFLQGAFSVTLSSFVGAMIAVVLCVLLSMVDRSASRSTIVLSGIVVHSLAQTVLMCLKITADPEKELSSIEYWIMGSLSGISASSVKINLLIALLCLAAVMLLSRQLMLLSAEEGEARMLGVNVGGMRFLILGITTLMVASIISMTGLISFVGLLAPHCARLLTKRNDTGTMMLSCIIGGIVLCLADVLARSVARTDLPVSIFTSLIGAPFLFSLVIRRRTA